MRIEMPYLNYPAALTNQSFLSTRSVLEFQADKDILYYRSLPPVLVMYIVDGQNNLLSGTPFTVRLIRELNTGAIRFIQVDVTSFV